MPISDVQESEHGLRPRRQASPIGPALLVVAALVAIRVPAMGAEPPASQTANQRLGQKKMALKQTTQAGSFTAGTTWIGGVAPVSGDTLAINHAVTWTPTAGSSFTIGTGTGVAATFGGGGRLLLTPAGAFTLTFAGTTAGGCTTAPEFVANSVNGPITINLDATANTTGFAMITAGTYSNPNLGGWNLVGNATNRITVASLPADASKNSWFTAGGQYGGGVDASYTTFLRIGNVSQAGFTPALDNRSRNVTWSNVTLDKCGQLTLGADSSHAGTISLTNVVSKNTATNGTTTYPASLSFGNPVGTRTITNCVWDKTLKFAYMYNAAFSNNYFHNGWAGSQVASPWSSMNNCFIRQTFDSLVAYGSITNSFLYWDNPNGDTPHWIGSSASLTPGTVVNWNGNVAYYNGNDSKGNVFLTSGNQSAITINCKNNLILPNAAGVNSGALMTADGAVTPGLALFIEHNTVFVKGQHALEIGHLYTVNETPNRYASVKSNLFIGGGTGFKAYNVDSTTTLDLIPPALADYNASYEIKLSSATAIFGNEGRGYAGNFSSTPGVHDIDIATPPSFIDATASLARWAKSQGSAASTALGNEADALTYLQANPGLTSSLLTFIKNGFAPTDPTLKGTAHDGGDIGAVSVQLPVVPPRTAFSHGTSRFSTVY